MIAAQVSESDIELLNFLKSSGLGIVISKYSALSAKSTTDATSAARLHDILQLGLYTLSVFETVQGRSKAGIAMALDFVLSQVGGTGYLMFDWERLVSAEGGKLSAGLLHDWYWY